ncbi:hypothetical protein D6C84_09224 [Aureobasidium pullulans]|uniref:F-box domain-containing protein n=1 Tax=Aureobasidium pullulans TaxID=5580 RepID=A0A4V4KYX1_AURPU|nr:hypothetical protein D6C84_09224 [Aureobasidium pullulans]
MDLMSRSSNSAGSGHSPILSSSMRREREKAMSGVNTRDPSLPVDGYVAPWDRLPNETQINILRYLGDPELRNMATRSETLWTYSIAFLWETVIDDQRIKQLVERVPAIRQQLYADLIKVLRVNTSNGIDLSHLAFQKLRELEVNTCGVGPHVNLPIAQFIQQKLEYLSIRRGDPALTHGTVSNFLPQLSRAPFLREIKLTGAIINAHPQDLVEGLKACPLVDTFEIGYNARPLMSPELFAYLAKNDRIQEFDWGRSIDEATIAKTMEDLKEDEELFTGLTGFDAHLSDVAGSLLLPRMQSITVLILGYDQNNLHILRSVREMKNLDILSIRAAGRTETGPDAVRFDWGTLSGLRDMNLTSLHIETDYRIDEDGNPHCTVNGSAIQMNQLSHIFGSHQTLRNLEFGWHQSAYLVNHDTIRVMDIIGKAYPELQTLTMNVSIYDPASAEVSAEVGPLIPKLEYLKMNFVVETIPNNDQVTG